MGFTVVDVNMRGTGCSGGAFDFFEPLQSLDGYDVIETIARQPWVAHHKVGMMGISYGGISQLFTAQTRPPSLAAISPLSVIDATQTTLYPGGILNTGFAVDWAKERVARRAAGGPEAAASRGPTSGSRAATRPARPTRRCTAEAADLLEKVRANNHYVPKVADPLAPSRSCTRSTCRSSWPASAPTSRPAATARRWPSSSTGTTEEVVHVHQRHPRRLARPGDVQPLVRLPRALRGATGADHQRGGDPARGAGRLPGGDGHRRRDAAAPTRSRQEPTYDGALAAFEKLPPIRVLFDNGAGGAPLASRYPGFEQSFARFPVPGTQGAHVVPRAGAARSAQGADAKRGADVFTLEPARRGR